MNISTPPTVVRTTGVVDGVIYARTQRADGTIDAPIATVSVDDVPPPYATREQIDEVSLGEDSTP